MAVRPRRSVGSFAPFAWRMKVRRIPSTPPKSPASKTTLSRGEACPAPSEGAAETLALCVVQSSWANTNAAKSTSRVSSRRRSIVVVPRLKDVVQGSTRATSSRPRVSAWTSFACLPDDPRKIRGLSIVSTGTLPQGFEAISSHRQRSRRHRLGCLPGHRPGPTEGGSMGYITTKDGTQIYYKDWGKGQPIVFSHGWPLSADAWEDQMFFLASRGYRCIAHDRRGHGRSSQPWDGNDMDTYADDLAALVEELDLKDAIHVGHSTGGGEVARYIGRHGTKRVAGAVLIGAVPPLMLKTPSNPEGTPIEEFDKLRSAVVADRSKFWDELSMPFYGYNRPGAKVSEGVKHSFWLQSMMAGFPASYFCIKAFSETDFNEDLKKFDVPTLILHGDDDQIVPIGAAALKSSKLVKDAKLKVYKGAPHGMCTTLKDQVNADLLEFLGLRAEQKVEKRKFDGAEARKPEIQA